MYAGFGPYNLVDFTDDGTMTFEAREDYTWGPQPKVQTIVYSIIGDPVAAVQAMENEEVDIIQPQATADILTQLEGIADRGVEVIQDDGATYEHIDLAVNNGGPFDPAAYGGDAEKALAVRRAFLHAVPRQDIVDRLIIPLNENATVRNAQVAVPGEPFYDELVADNGSDEYAETDIAMSQQILEEAGIDTSTPIDVRLLFADENPRRAATYDLLRESVAQAGFNLDRRPGHQLGREPVEHVALRRGAVRLADDVHRGGRLDAELRHGRSEQLLRVQQPRRGRVGRRAERHDRSRPPGRDPDRGRAEPVRRCVRAADLPASVDHRPTTAPTSMA